MDIDPVEVSIGQLVEDYVDDGEGGVFGYSGRLDIRPPYQREFIYVDKQRDLVINTVRKGFPLNVMYWALTGDDKYEIIDGQQRTISVCQYVTSQFSVDGMYFHNLTADQKEQIFKYQLTVYVCSGPDSEKLEWFKTINIAGEELTDQELRNAVYSGPWVTDAKRYFSRRNGPAYGLAGAYLNGLAIRQEYLETVISWIDEGTIEDYMGAHQEDENAEPLWKYFEAVIAWVEKYFPNYRSPMKGLPWGELYNVHKDDDLDPDQLEERVSELFADEYEVTRQRGIYPYLLDGDERHLSLRKFDEQTKRTTYEKQQGICPLCSEHFDYGEMAGDHIVPWSKGGKTVPENCQMLCVPDNIKKSNG